MPERQIRLRRVRNGTAYGTRLIRGKEPTRIPRQYPNRTSLVAAKNVEISFRSSYHGVT